MANINILIANATGTLTPYLPMIHAAFDKAVADCHEKLGADDVDILFSDETDHAIPETGVGGRASAYIVDLSVDVSSKKLSGDEIYYTLCHELHHAKRYQGTAKDKTLFDCVATEGLAVCFEDNMSSGASFISSYMKRQPYINLLVDKFIPNFDSTDYDDIKWFIEDTSKELPRWAGYIVGYHIISRYMAHTKKTAAELVLEPSEKIRKFVNATLARDMTSV